MILEDLQKLSAPSKLDQAFIFTVATTFPLLIGMGPTF
jgi:hypothetical protein